MVVVSPLVDRTNHRYFAWDTSTRFQICRSQSGRQITSALKARVDLAEAINQRSLISGFYQDKEYLCLATSLLVESCGWVKTVIRVPAKLLAAIRQMIATPGLMHILTETEKIDPVASHRFASPLAQRPNTSWWQHKGKEPVPLTSLDLKHDTCFIRTVSLLDAIRQSSWHDFVRRRPVQVLDLENGRYLLLDGCHRTDLSRIIGFTDESMPAEVYIANNDQVGRAKLEGARGYVQIVQECFCLDQVDRRFKRNITALINGFSETSICKVDTKPGRMVVTFNVPEPYPSERQIRAQATPAAREFPHFLMAILGLRQITGRIIEAVGQGYNNL